MRRRFFVFFILFVLIVPQLKLSGIVAKERPLNILVLHAYHLGYPWTYNQNEGIRETLLEYAPDMNIYTEFLDWKRFPDEESIHLQYIDFINKYSDVPIDLILTTDDMGLEFALKYREELFSDAPIVFSGIIGHTALEIIGDEQDVTGVYENMKPEGIIDLMQVLQPEVSELYVVHDLSESGIRTKDTFLNALEKRQVESDYQITNLSQYSFDEIKEKISVLDKKSAVILISYNISTDGLVLKPEVFCHQFNEVSSVPMYSIDEFLFGEGIVGGTFLSGVLQGKALARLGVEILEGADPDDLEHVAEATVYTGVDEEILDKYRLDIDKLSDDVIIVNEKFSFFEEYKTLVLTVGGILAGLILFILVLLFLMRIIQRSNKEIYGQKMELQALYEQQQATEEELQAQNEELQTYQEHLEFEAHHDFLTTLPNRIGLSSNVERIFKECRENGNKVMVVFIDLDNFKFVNNTFGHQFGDEVLIHVARLLEQVIEGGFVARIGGDEFVLVKEYEEFGGTALVERWVSLISQNISREITVGHEKIRITASLGYSIYPDDGRSYDELIIEADVAMYQVKKEGKASVRRYKKAMSNILENDYILLSSLKQAIDDDEFYLEYQPLVHANQKEVYGFEALLRWKSNIHGLVQPLKFISIAESSGLIIPIGAIVIRKSLECGVRLSKIFDKEFLVSINVSVVQFYEENFVDDLLDEIERAGIKPEQVQVEITESVMIDTYNLMIEKMKFLRTKGISIALDDFGTGYSSLSYIHELPIDELKIDKLFVDDINKSTTKSPLVDATLTLAKSFDFKVIAEGVETKEQLDYLHNKGCDFIQGYYVSKPLKEEALRLFIAGYSQ